MNKQQYKLTSYKKYKIGDKLKHKACDLMLEIVGFEYDIFGTYVVVKIIDHFEWKHLGHYYGAIETYDVSILQEYKIIQENTTVL